MGKEINIVCGAGVCVGGNSPASLAVEVAMRNEVMNGIASGEDPGVTKARVMAARFDAKPPERR